VTPTQTFETLVCRLFRDGVQFRSGLVDLVVCVRRHHGGGHRLTLVGERFVSLVAEHIAQVRDRGAELGESRRGEGTECETGDGGCRFVASEPVENTGKDGQRDADRRGVARIVVVADCQSEVIERGQRVAVFGLGVGQTGRQESSARLVANGRPRVVRRSAQGRGLQFGCGSGQQCVAVAVQRRIDTPAVDGVLGIFSLLAARNHVAVPALGIYRTCRS
jgi:hypothetical protein